MPVPIQTAIRLLAAKTRLHSYTPVRRLEGRANQASQRFAALLQRPYMITALVSCATSRKPRGMQPRANLRALRAYPLSLASCTGRRAGAQAARAAVTRVDLAEPYDWRGQQRARAARTTSSPRHGWPMSWPTSPSTQSADCMNSCRGTGERQVPCRGRPPDQRCVAHRIATEVANLCR